MRFLFVFALLALAFEPSFHFRSDVERLAVDAAQLDQRTTPGGSDENWLAVHIKNGTEDTIILLQGIVCVGTAPGTNVNDLGPECQEMYFGDRFHPHASTWSTWKKLRPILRPGRPVYVRILKVQTVEDD